MNICIVTGNLGEDPKSMFTSDGTHIANFDLAVRSGKDRTSWLKVACFNKVAETVEKYLHKGAKIAVVGMIDQSKWETETGEKRSMIRLIANNIEFIKTDGRGLEGKEPPDGDVPF